MGALKAMLPQGPNQHCGSASPHERHANPSTLYATAWCDGVPILEPFVELLIRVPLTAVLEPEEKTTHEEELALIIEEGLSTYIWDELDNPNTRASLRLRWGGIDRAYPVIQGKVRRGEPAE